VKVKVSVTVWRVVVVGTAALSPPVWSGPSGQSLELQSFHCFQLSVGIADYTFSI
jgi:hypothetical protein